MSKAMPTKSERQHKFIKKNKPLLRRISRAQVEDHFISFQPRFRSTKWLHKANRYRYSCTARYDHDVRATPSTVNDDDLISYISASAPTHVIDGWSYLGRAVDATLRGDSYAATHMGYYAELRAAMGLLASEGIGIFGKFHAVVDDKGATHSIKGQGTHFDIWPTLRYWATLQPAADLLDELVRPSSIPLSDWLTKTHPKVPMRAVAQRWLRSWGLDLADVEDDHDCRNLASYRPSEFRRPESLDVHQRTGFVEDLWQLCEPGSVRRFPNLERHLLRNAYRKGAGTAPAVSDLQSLGLTPLECTDWVAFLQQTEVPIAFSLAEEWVPVEDPTCHLRIIARAALLLFIASAAARRLLSNAEYSSGDILFWWSRHGEDRALWDTGSIPGDPQDLWADIAEAIDDSAAWRASHLDGSASLRGWRQSQTGALADLGGFELAAIWALMP